MSYGPPPGYPQPQYGPQPGYPGYGQPYGQPYGRPPGPPSTALAYVSAGLFLICGILALVIAIGGWDVSLEEIDMVVALVGAQFGKEIVGNGDAAVAATMTAACSTLTFAVVLLFRLDFVRWLLAFVGGLVSVYYLYAVIKLLADGGGEFIAMVLVSFLLWTAATVVVLLPATGRAMRGYQRKLGQYPPQPMGYPY